ncbi:MAG: hypothetical protein ACOYKD_03625 [Anaerolineaceae bacterium]|jgi:hypothetical protein
MTDSSTEKPDLSAIFPAWLIDFSSKGQISNPVTEKDITREIKVNENTLVTNHDPEGMLNASILDELIAGEAAKEAVSEDWQLETEIELTTEDDFTLEERIAQLDMLLASSERKSAVNYIRQNLADENFREQAIVSLRRVLSMAPQDEPLVQLYNELNTKAQ